MNEQRNEIKLLVRSLKEIKAGIKADLKSARADTERWKKETAKTRAQLVKMENLWRSHLDECDQEDDDEWESEARQILWNESDGEEARRAGGWKGC